MQLEIRVNAKGVEVANYLLGVAFRELAKNPELQKGHMLSATDIKQAKAVQKSLTKALLKRSKCKQLAK